MTELKKTVPQVRISYDGMQAYMRIPHLRQGKYTVRELREALQSNGIVHGIKQNVLDQIISENICERELLVAEGTASVEGADGYFEYHFNRNLNNKPTVRSDGTVDYWSIHRIEIVEKDQLLATYHPAVMGKDGMTVKGQVLSVKRARELPPLKGKGFQRSEDNKLYHASFEGKVELSNGRLMVLQVYEVMSNVDLTVGDIDFSGDVIIHGNVTSGVTIKAGGNITVDGIVEVATLWSGKDIILRGGMMGESKSTVYAKGSISAKFFEYTTVEAEGDINAEIFMNCRVTCRKQIILSGKRAAIIGGDILAVKGIETGNLGNEVELKTEVSVGNGSEVLRRVHELEKQVQKSQELLEDIEKNLQRFATLEKVQTKKLEIQKMQADNKKVQLLRAKIQEVANLGTINAELDRLQKQLEDGEDAYIRVMKSAYPGVKVRIDDAVLHVRSRYDHVEYKNYQENIVSNQAF